MSSSNPHSYQSEGHSSSVLPSDVPQRVAEIRETFRSGKTQSYEWRLQQLKQLRRLLTEGRQRISEAMWKDLHRSRFETWVLEISTIEAEIGSAIDDLHNWMKPEKVSTNLANFPGSSYIKHDPLGVALIMSPWNYPVQLALSPLVGAIAAGNCAVLRPAHYTSHVSEAIADLVSEYMDPECFAVVTGARDATTAVLSERFDIIFFTGGATLGRIVHAAANKHLTPVVLELGGKSPAYVHSDADLDVTAKRIAWASFINAGQTCVRPDYVLAHESIVDKLIPKLRKYVSQFYTAASLDTREFGYEASHQYALANPNGNVQSETLDAEAVKASPYFGRLIDGGDAVRRIKGIIDADKDFLVFGGDVDEAERFVAPTLLDFGNNIQQFNDSAAMKDEIFGPILPILTVTDEGQAVEMIGNREKPLACYCFAGTNRVKDLFLNSTTSGSLVFNDAIVQLSNHHLPFGGVGMAGMGTYHGKYSFDAFSHRKAVLYKTGYLDLDARYAPYNGTKEKMLQAVSGHIPKNYIRLGAGVIGAAVVAAVVLGTKKYW